MEFAGRDADNGAYEESLVEVHRRCGLWLVPGRRMIAKYHIDCEALVASR